MSGQKSASAGHVSTVSGICLLSILLSRRRNTVTLVNDSVPFLSVYMGHKNIWETEKYLKFSSEMFPELSEPFETFADSLFPEVSYED